MMKQLSKQLSKCEFFEFNQNLRDKWVKYQASLIPPGAKVLDVGAGSAPYRALFSHCHYSTQDFTALRADQLRDNGYSQIDFICDATAIPTPNASFDVIVCTEMLEHVAEPSKVIDEFSRILAPGGKLILTAPLGSGVHQEPFHYYGGYTSYWYELFLTRAGFEQITVQPNGGSFLHYSQECFRFLKLSRPFRLKLPLPLELLFVPIWLILLPILGIFIPFICRHLDVYDKDNHFSVGYFVTALKQLE
jgi:SAM-dependent methyltransferase